MHVGLVVKTEPQIMLMKRMSQVIFYWKWGSHRGMDMEK